MGGRGDMERMRVRRLKASVLDLLGLADMDRGLEEIRRFPPRVIVNPLFSLLFHPEPMIKWGAVTAMGAVTADLAEENLESARVIMRRLMWNLNDESGGIGWGSPEAMGEIMARQEALARGYASILLSYLQEDGNFLDPPPLRKGVLWGIGRLAQERPRLPQGAGPEILPYLGEPDAEFRGLAVWAVGNLGFGEAGPILETLLEDGSTFSLYRDRRLAACSVGKEARLALAKIEAAAR